MPDVERIRAIIRHRGIPYAEVARRAGLSRRTIYNLLEGTDSSLETSIALAKVLEVPLSEIDPEGAARIAEVA